MIKLIDKIAPFFWWLGRVKINNDPVKKAVALMWASQMFLMFLVVIVMLPAPLFVGIQFGTAFHAYTLMTIWLTVMFVYQKKKQLNNNFKCIDEGDLDKIDLS